jgi:hypothetical protein
MGSRALSVTEISELGDPERFFISKLYVYPDVIFSLRSVLVRRAQTRSIVIHGKLAICRRS